MFDVHSFVGDKFLVQGNRRLIAGPFVVRRKLIVGQLPATAHFFEFQGDLGLDALIITGSAIPDTGPGPMITGVKVNNVAGIQADQVFAVKTVADNFFAVLGVMAAAGGTGGTTVKENQTD
jgi:hypothetical protein